MSSGPRLTVAAVCDRRHYCALQGKPAVIDRVNELATSGCGSFNNGGRSASVFSSALGGGIDMRPRKHVAFRVQADDLMTHFGDRYQHFFRLSFGTVIPLKLK